MDGHWWLPGRQDAPAAGTLSYQADGTLNLSLVGVLNGQPPSLEVVRYQTILGRMVTGEDVTLCNCAQSWRKPPTANQPGAEEIDVGVVYVGANLPDGIETPFQVVAYQFDNLAFWSATEPVVHHDLQNGKRVLRVAESRFFSTDIGVGTLRLNVGVAEQQTLGNFYLRRGASIGVELASPMTASEVFSKVTRPLQQFITFVCDAPGHVRRLTFGSAEHTPPHLPQGAVFPTVECVYRGDVSHSEDQDVAFMLVPLRDVEDELALIVATWFEHWAKVGPALDLWLGMQLSPESYVETRFLLLAQALEVYARLRFPDQQKLGTDHKARRTRVVQLVTDPADNAWLQEALHYFHEPTLAERLETLKEYSEVGYHGVLRIDFSEAIKNTRNYFTHYDNKSRRKAVTDPADLYRLTEEAAVLLQSCVLRDLGFDEGRSWGFQHHTRRVRSLLMTGPHVVS